MAEPGFWDAAERTRQVVEDVRILKRWIEPFDALNQRVTDAQELAHLNAAATECHRARVLLPPDAVDDLAVAHNQLGNVYLWTDDEQKSASAPSCGRGMGWWQI